MQHMSWLRDFQSIATLGRLSFRLLILAWAAGCFGNGCPLPYSRDGLRGVGNSVWGTSRWVSPHRWDEAAVLFCVAPFAYLFS